MSVSVVTRTLHRRWQLTSVAAGGACRATNGGSAVRSARRAALGALPDERDRDRRDPLAPLAELPGVARGRRGSAGGAGPGPPASHQSARLADDRGRGRRCGRRGPPRCSTVAPLQFAADAGRARTTRCWPVRCGWPRHSRAATTPLVGVWQRAPLQAHGPAARAGGRRPGRRRRGSAGRAATRRSGRRLELLADIVTGGSRVPAPVLAAVAHGELLTLAAVRHRRRRRRAGGVAAGDDRQRSGPARSRRAGGVLDAPLRRLPGRGARVRLGHARRLGGVAGAELPGAARRCAGGVVDRARPRATVAIGSSKREAGDAPKLSSARRPLARTPVTKRARWVAWVASAFLRCATTADPTQRAVVVVRSSQLRRPATLLPISRHVLRVGAGIRAG